MSLWGFSVALQFSRYNPKTTTYAEKGSANPTTMDRIELALPVGGGLMMDEDAASIVAQIKTLLRQLRTKGATDKDIDSLLAEEEKPGRAYVDSAGMLVLPDAGNVKIKLTPMERTLYILFLRYPEGINADELWRYRDELCGIYGSLGTPMYQESKGRLPTNSVKEQPSSISSEEILAIFIKFRQNR